MIPRAYITEWRSIAPWAQDSQVDDPHPTLGADLGSAIHHIW